MSNEENPHRRIGKGMITIAWIIALLIGTHFFGQWEKQQINPNQELASYTSANGDYVLEIKRNRFGHFVIPGTINNHLVTFLIDTGATDVVIPEKLANDIGLRKGGISYAQTANGTIAIYNTILDQLSIGEIHLSQIRASINPHMSEDSVLLGMSALKKLAFSQKNNILTIQYHP